MDATKNTVASVDISVFPTLKLFAMDNNKMVDFSGEFETDTILIEFP
jgi:hypothetical protein